MTAEQQKSTDLFLQAKPQLMGIAYRMLGTCKDAEDIVQDVYVKLTQVEAGGIASPTAWMTTVCTRLCLDRLKSAQQKRVDYVGPWLPEPVSEGYGSEHFMELSASLSTAFLLMLERLSPKERAVFLLREIFEHDYSLIAAAMDINEAACRKLFSRAKENISQNTQRFSVDQSVQQRFLASFEQAVREGDASGLQDMLAQDVLLTVDGGGKVSAISRDLHGKKEVSKFIAKALHRYHQGLSWETTNINGQLGVVVSLEGSVSSILSFGYDNTEENAGKVSKILIMRNPEKMGGIQSIKKAYMKEHSLLPEGKAGGDN